MILSTLIIIYQVLIENLHHCYLDFIELLVAQSPDNHPICINIQYTLYGLCWVKLHFESSTPPLGKPLKGI
jgi:hypothetical protein